MFNLDEITNANNKEHNKKWLYIPDHPLQQFDNWLFGMRRKKSIIKYNKSEG